MLKVRILNYLRKWEKLVYFNRCWIHRNDADFRQMVLEGYQNPDFLKLQTMGDAYEGKTIYLIREQGNGMGFFAEVGVVLIKLYFAYERGFIPYVEWGDRYLYYEAEGVEGEYNAFQHYFMPVSDVRDVRHALHVLEADGSHYRQVKEKFDAVSYDVSEEYIDAMADMMGRYLRYNEKTALYLERECDALLGKKKTIGVHYRGTDFHKQYNNHPVAVQIEQEIERVQELLEKGGYEQIFLATDENAAVAKFRGVFGERVKVYRDVFREDGEESIAFSSSDRSQHHYRLGLEVMRDEYTLVQCDALVCGYSNVTFIARIMKRAWQHRKYEDYELINNGIHHNDNYFWKSQSSLRKGMEKKA